MKKLAVTAVVLFTLIWIGCGGDDGDGPKPDDTIIVTADTMTAPAIPLTPDDAAWNSVAAISIPLSGGAPLPAGPTRSPLGPGKSLGSAPETVDVQAIKKGGHLFLRFQWTDPTLSMERDNWELFDKDGFNFNHRTDRGEDQVVVLLEGAPDGWDMWNWRVLTTGEVGRAEDGTISEGDTTWDAGPNRAFYVNELGSDPFSPPYFHVDEWNFTGDVLHSDDIIPRSQAISGKSNWTVGQTVPGWILDDNVNWASVTESRWDVHTAYDYDADAEQYTLVMMRDLTGNVSAGDDLDMSELSRVTARVGVLDEENDLSPGTSGRAFSGDIYIDLP